MDVEDSSEEEGSDNVQELVQLLAWAGGLWFFIVHMVMQPLISTKVHRRLPPYFHNIGNQIFFDNRRPDVPDTPRAAEKHQDSQVDQVQIEEFDYVDDDCK